MSLNNHNDKAQKVAKLNSEAWSLFKKKKYKEALEIYDKAIELDKDDKDSYLHKGKSLGNLKRYEEAIKSFDNAIKLDASYEAAWIEKAAALNAIGRYEEALDAYDELIKLSGPDKNILNSKAMISYNMNEYEKALAIYDKALEGEEKLPIDITLLYNKGHVLNSLKRNWESEQCLATALAKCKTYLKQSGPDSFYSRIKGEIELHKKKHFAARATLNKAIKECVCDDEKATLWNSLCILYYDKKKYGKAIDACNQAIDLNLNNFEAWLNKGRTLYKQKKYKELSEEEFCYKKALEIYPSEPYVYQNLSELYMEIGNNEGALDMANEALSLDKTLVNPIIVKTKILIENKEYKEALTILKNANALKAGNIKIKLWELYVKYLQTSYQKGDNRCEKCDECSDCKTKEEVASIIRNLERLTALSSKLEGTARKQLQAQLLYLLANFYLKNDDIYSAKERLESCIKLAKNPLKRSARGLLSNIWNRLIKPKWWSWWIISPVYKWIRRVTFGTISTLLLALFGFSIINPTAELLNLPIPPMLKELFQLVSPDNPMLILLTGFLIFLLVMPSINSFKAKDFEVELHSLTAFDPTLSPSSIEEAIKQLTGDLPESPLYSVPTEKNEKVNEMLMRNRRQT